MQDAAIIPCHPLKLMMGRVRVWFHSVPSPTLANDPSANGWLSATWNPLSKLHCQAQFFLSVQVIGQRIPCWFASFGFMTWNSFGYSRNSQFDRCLLLRVNSAHRYFLSKCCVASTNDKIYFGFVLLLVKAGKFFVKEWKYTQIH